jgi:hypothetical protein
MVPSGTTSLVPPILTPLDQGGWTTHKNANHYKTCIEWDAIIKHFPKATASCIIVTTREKNIAKHCSEDERNIYRLHGLNNEYARILFTKKVRIK